MQRTKKAGIAPVSSKPTRLEVRKQSKTPASAAGGVLGNIVTWQVPSSVPFERLKQALADAGLDTDLVRELAPYYALTRSLADMRKGRVIRKLRRDGNVVHFQLTRETLGPTEATYDKEAELSIDTKTGLLTCRSERVKARAEQLIDEHKAKRMATDIATLMFRIYKAYSGDLIAIREQGGVYFVPEQHTKLVDQTRKLLDGIDGALLTFEVRLGSGDTGASVAESMADHFERLVKQFKETCANIDSTTREDVRERRLATIAELRQKMDLYRGLLSGYADHIKGVIAEANDELLKKLTQ